MCMEPSGRQLPLSVADIGRKTDLAHWLREILFLQMRQFASGLNPEQPGALNGYEQSRPLGHKA